MQPSLGGSLDQLSRAVHARGRLASVEPGRCEELIRSLDASSSETRAEAARVLRSYGARAVEPLCRALQDQDVNVRIAAAASLGYIGDGRAVQPLTEALRRLFIGQSARWRLTLRNIGIGGAVSLGMGFLLGWSIPVGVAAGYAVHLMLMSYAGRCSDFDGRPSHSGLCHTITEALAQIAEWNASPDMLAVVPDLKAIAADVLREEKQVRITSRQVAERIESLTEKLKSLPVAASTPDADTSALPRPAEAPAPNAETLPRVQE